MAPGWESEDLVEMGPDQTRPEPLKLKI